MKKVVTSDGRFLYLHQCWGRLLLECPDKQKWEGMPIVKARKKHRYLTLDWGKKSYMQGFPGPRRVLPLTVQWNGNHLGELDYYKRNVNSFHAKGHHVDTRARALVKHLSVIVGQPVSYELNASYVEVCAFVSRKYRRRLLDLCRHAAMQFALARSEKKIDRDYNGVPSEYVSGELQYAKGEPTFRLKLYEAIHPHKGFKAGQAPKLEVQVKGRGTLDELISYGEHILTALLNLSNADTIVASQVCTDKDGARSYRRIIPEPFKGQGNPFANELRVFETISKDEESFRQDERWPLYEAIYHRGLRCKKELVGGGFSERAIKRAVEEGQLLLYGAGGRGGNSYRVNLLPRLTDQPRGQ